MRNVMNVIGLACDHAGYDLKVLIKYYLINSGYDIRDYGCDSAVSCDYPDYAHKLGKALEINEINIGLVFCGSGNGINMTVNKHQGVRSALCWNTEIAFMARHHNDANVCSIPSRYVDVNEAVAIIDVFLKENFDGGRHTIRINKIPIID